MASFLDSIINTIIDVELGELAAAIVLMAADLCAGRFGGVREKHDVILPAQVQAEDGGL